MIKLIATDLDGTLISSGNTVKRKDSEAIIHAHECGAEIVIATGRNYTELPECVTNLPVRYFITANGSELYDREDDKILAHECLDFDDAKEIMRRCKELGCYAMYYVGRKVYCTSNFREYTDKLEEGLSWKILEKGFIRCDNIEDLLPEAENAVMKIVLLFDSEEERDEKRPLFNDLEDRTEICASCPDNIEFNPKGVSKGMALSKITELHNIKSSEIATIGDGDNDIPMLELTPSSFAPKGATQLVKKTANTIVCDSSDCAVAEVIGKLFP